MFQRFVEHKLLEALKDTPVVLIHGSRQSGKTTLAQMADFKGLVKLRDSIGDKFVKGIVFYDGESILSFGDRLFAIPYAAFLLK
jgi:predicted AAA+ superfamily ATPase